LPGFFPAEPAKHAAVFSHGSAGSNLPDTVWQIGRAEDSPDTVWQISCSDSATVRSFPCLSAPLVALRFAHATGSLPPKLFVSEYLTALPDQKVLVAELEKTRKRLEARR
jgi:hypothetical protein